MGKLLVVDDDPLVRTVLEKACADWGHEVDARADVHAAVRVFESGDFDLVLADLWLPGASGLDLLAELVRTAPHVPVIVMSASASTSMIVAALQGGAVDFVQKTGQHGIELESIQHAVGRALAPKPAHGPLVDAGRPGDRSRMEGIVGRSRVMQGLFSMIDQVAQQDVTVLLLGESGTGKELCARALHSRSRRAAGRLQVVNCAALQETLLASELFGHERGSFTGATNSKPGHFEVAGGGTILLDEVGEAPASVQASLLRVLQEKEIFRVGGTEPIPVDVRIIAATNRDLAADAEAGKFRWDLYHRLSTFPITVPALRDRKEDVPLLVEVLLARRCGAPRTIDEGALAVLREHDWPGNVRELENVLARADILAGREDIRYEHVAAALGLGGAGPTPPPTAAEQAASDPPAMPAKAALGPKMPEAAWSAPYREARAEFERVYLLQLLRDSAGNVSRAARASGLGRAALYTKLRSHGLTPEAFRERDE